MFGEPLLPAGHRVHAVSNCSPLKPSGSEHNKSRGSSAKATKTLTVKSPETFAPEKET